jgi:hypothetical protein
MPGPAPKPDSKRRRYARPKSYGAAQPTTAPAAPPVNGGRSLGTDNPHALITAMWDTVQSSFEAAFYSETDWQRLRLELWFANHTMARSTVRAGLGRHPARAQRTAAVPGGQTPGRHRSAAVGCG